MGFTDWLLAKDGAAAWLRADGYRVPRDFAISAVVGTAAVAVGATVGLPVLAAVLVGGVVGSLAVYGVEHLIHREAPSVTGVLLAGAIGIVGGSAGGLGGSVVGGVVRGMARNYLGVQLSVVESRFAGSIMGRGAAGALGSDVREAPFRTRVGDAKTERGIATGLSFYEQLQQDYELPDLEPPSPKLTKGDLLDLPDKTSRTGVPNEPPPGTANVVIGVVRPSSWSGREGYDHNVIQAPTLARDYHATLITGDRDHDMALTRADIEKQLSGLARDKKLHALVVVGHSGEVPSDRDEAVASLAPDQDSALAKLPFWGGIGVVIGAPGHRETLVPGLQTILEKVAAEHHEAVSDLFSKDAVIEFVDCQVGKNEVWMQDLANMTGARVVAYKNDVSALRIVGHRTDASGLSWGIAAFRGIDDGAGYDDPEDGRVEFEPQPSKTKGFVDSVGAD
ncbi:MAG TPA: hypothetical protein VFF73_11805 [Planctomycetota bacterium]|nr:hypothetical protein [Planctomycetota bacterium]